MFRRGPIPPLVHGVLDYVYAVVLIAAPFVLNFDDDTAIALSIALGLLALILGAFTAWTTGIVKSIPVVVHTMLDYVLSIFLIAAPFLLGFNKDDTASAFFVVLGILGLVLTIATRYLPASRPRSAPSETQTPASTA
jgi:hypothetical protein